ncbi:Ca(2+)-dependent cysteine protease [Pleurotus ostreatus]|uniref:Ca(2+)-dependent cysteine protease n=1 Tax=Pleurotus ostreatus TaxID=5322 RepID=A0A8H6ZR91_PLEOS|nr:Ca(2+)-dependent cysteine protease [Pleurotus ostreatus]KAF7421266.1 Ca(2+)-dependent cysteine protease [Pleurotus ostreatus]
MDSGSPRKRALLIGIEYIRSTNPELGRLTGPAEETEKLASLLRRQYGYYPEDIITLTDKDKNFLRQPTRENILREIDDLVADVEPGDRILFHYSGHCGQYPRLDGTEEDNLDEAIEALDGPILDDILKEHLVDPLPAGSTLVAILDTCHSETLLDLPHYHCNRVYVPLKHTGSNLNEDDYTTPNWRLQRLKGMNAPRRKFPMRPAKSAYSTYTNMKAMSLSIRIPRRTSLAVLPDDAQCSSSDSEITESPMQEVHHHCPPTPGLNDLKPTVIAISAAKDSQSSYFSITTVGFKRIVLERRELPLEDLITQLR